mgnify:CR=1 FL=1
MYWLTGLGTAWGFYELYSVEGTSFSNDPIFAWGMAIWVMLWVIGIRIVIGIIKWVLKGIF